MSFYNNIIVSTVFDKALPEIEAHTLTAHPHVSIRIDGSSVYLTMTAAQFAELASACNTAIEAMTMKLEAAA